MKRVAAGTLAACLLAFGCSAPQRISDSGHGAFEASLDAYDDGLAVAWHDTRNGNAEIYLRFVDLQGQPLANEHRLTEADTDSYEANIRAADDGFVVAWYERSDDTYTARLGMWERSGEPRWTAVIGPDTKIPVVVADRGRILCAWLVSETDSTTVWAGWWDFDGRSVGSPQRLGAAGPTWNLNATIDDSGVAWVVYDARIETKAEELWMASLDGDTAELRRLTSDDGKPSTFPDLALGDKGAALTWLDERDGNREVYLFVGKRPELEARLETQAKRITSTPGESIGASIAWNGDRLGLTWSDDSSGRYEVYFRDFDAAGDTLEQARRITRNDAGSLIPAIVPWRSGFALAWNDIVIDPDRHPHSPETLSEVHLVVVP